MMIVLGPGSGSGSAIWAPAASFTLLLLLLFTCLTPPVTGLSTAPGSPCEDVCHKTSTNTTSVEIVCEDKQFSNTRKGSHFAQCVECELDSDYVDPGTGETDVAWGLFNLRYTLTSCLFGYPKQVVNTSSPCVVSCQSLDSALEYEITSPSTLNFDTFCKASSFADNVIDQCEFCYNLTTTQVYIANFLEAIRYNCHFQTPTGSSFDIPPGRIFSQSLLPSTESTPTSSPSHHGVKNLTLVIALPILGFVLLVCGTTLCCFFFIRHRRKKARKQRQSSHLYARWDDTTISTPVAGWEQQQQYGQYGPAGFGFVDSDGRGGEVGYAYANSKPGFVEVTEPTLPVGGGGRGEGELEKGPTEYCHAVYPKG